MSTPDEATLRLECLKLAIEARGDVLADARAFFAFVSGDEADPLRRLARLEREMGSLAMRPGAHEARP